MEFIEVPEKAEEQPFLQTTSAIGTKTVTLTPEEHEAFRAAQSRGESFVLERNGEKIGIVFGPSDGE